MGDLLLGCSGWNYGDTPENGGWTGVFHPDVNALQFKGMSSMSMSQEDENALQQAESYLSKMHI
jgi:hypothetical protein